jgi:hypothetical protein
MMKYGINVHSVHGTPVPDDGDLLPGIYENCRISIKRRAEFEAEFDGVIIRGEYDSPQQLRDALRELLRLAERV